MAKTSKTVPQKEAASSSQSAGGKTPVEPRIEECIPGGCALNSDFKTDKASSVPELKKRTARKSRKNIIPLTEESVRRLRDEDEEEENDSSVLVARVKKTIDASKATGSIAVTETPPRTEGISEKDSGKVSESLEIEDASHQSEQMVGISEWTGPEALRTEENAPSDLLGEIIIGDLPTLPAFSEGAIREARALGTLEVDRAHEGEDPFHDLLTGIEDAADPSDASGLFFEDQQALNRALALHEEAFSKSQVELSRCEADFRGLSEERNSLKLLRTVANISVSQLQQKIERIEQFREEISTIKAESLGWKEGVDHLAAEKETVRAQLSSAESQLQDLKENSSAQAKKIGELEVQLASELVRAKTEAEKAKAEADAIVAIYRADAEAAQAQVIEATETAQRAYWITELSTCQSWRETLEKIHARGFDLTSEIVKAREHEVEVGALATSDDDDDDGSKSGMISPLVVSLAMLNPLRIRDAGFHWDGSVCRGLGHLVSLIPPMADSIPDALMLKLYSDNRGASVG
ncbi:uncharacterized protein [Nicotiana tomentosiformis]|uniref:uncharacterized protein n=1 Tax=Nicotiana tomentosiformis TaxID=4098 RepID=UPI00388CBB90